MTTEEVNAEVKFLGAFEWLLGMALLGLATSAVLFWNIHLALLALLPAVLLTVLGITKPRSRRVQFGETALVGDNPEQVVPYDEICGLTVNAVAKLPEEATSRGVVRILTRAAVIELPGRIDIGRREFLHGVLARIPLGGRMPEQPVLEQFARAEREQFNDERVWTFQAAERHRTRFGYGMVRLGLAFVGIVWLCAAFIHPLWATAAIIAFVTAVGLGAVTISSSRPKTIVGKNWRQSGLVISPTALAMIQGDLRGKLGWNEIKSVKFARQQLTIEVAGAKLIIHDFYDRPIQQIVELVNLNWSGREQPRGDLRRPSADSESLFDAGAH